MTCGALGVALRLTFAVFAFLLFAARLLFALRLREHAHVVFGVLLKVFRVHAVIRKLSIPRELIVLINDLLRCAAHFAFWAGTVEHTVHDIAHVVI